MASLNVLSGRRHTAWVFVVAFFSTPLAGPTFAQSCDFTTIDEIESLTGIDFLNVPEMSDTKEDAIEAFKASKLWPRK